MRPTIKVLALMEATTVSGPAKNLIEFGRRVRAGGDGREESPAVEVNIVTFHRGHAPGDGMGGEGAAVESAPNKFVAAARGAGVETDVLAERFRYDARVVAQLREVIARRKPDLVQTHQVKSHFLMKLSGLWRAHPWIAFHHGYTTPDLKMRVYNHINRWSLPTADRVVTVCESFARDLARAGVERRRIAVLHNSVEARPPTAASGVAELQALRERLGIREDERVVLAVGRLSQEKGHVDLVRALARLRGEQPRLDFKLVVVGDGPERRRVEREAAALGFGDRLVFAGHVGDVRPFYALADVLALPSHSEGSPNVLLEAMAAGLPVVATRVGGVPEIVAHEESALLVDAHDPQAFAVAVGRALTDRELARSLAGRASALAATRFSPESYRRSLVEIYRELISSPEASAKARAAVTRLEAVS
jgi:glycosyltransferase involved in cell wall biosynthesis